MLREEEEEEEVGKKRSKKNIIHYDCYNMSICFPDRDLECMNIGSKYMHTYIHIYVILNSGGAHLEIQKDYAQKSAIDSAHAQFAKSQIARRNGGAGKRAAAILELQESDTIDRLRS
jgi:hypothetical protein